jgi:hypothetical protein
MTAATPAAGSILAHCPRDARAITPTGQFFELVRDSRSQVGERSGRIPEAHGMPS